MAQRVSFDERARVEAMSAEGVGVAEIARRLGRHRSTVYRELGRGGGRGGYDAEAAQDAAAARAARPKTPKLVADPELAAAVAGGLAERWSPHAISAQLRAEGRAVCAETIYAACYDPRGSRGLRQGSWRSLPRCRRRRRPRGRAARNPSPLGDFKPVAARPASVEDRREAGHWEGDLIIGANNRSAVATLVERTSRLTLTVALPDGYSAESTARAVGAAGCSATIAGACRGRNIVFFMTARSNDQAAAAIGASRFDNQQWQPALSSRGEPDDRAEVKRPHRRRGPQRPARTNPVHRAP